MSKQQMAYSSRHHGFSIVEVMFAIMILGIGFILVAAMFPVAIQQSQATVDEVNARTITSNGAAQLLSVVRYPVPAQQLLLKSTPLIGSPQRPVVPNQPAIQVYRQTFPAGAWDVQAMYTGLRLSPQDQRYCWLAAYSYDYDASGFLTPPMVLNVFGLRATTVSQYEQSHLANTGFVSGTVRFVCIPGSPSRVIIDRLSVPQTEAQQAAVDGAAILITTDIYDTTPSLVIPSGTVFRLGSQLPSTEPLYDRTWEISPGSAQPAKSWPTGALPDIPATSVLMIGRALRDPASPWNVGTNPHEGGNQVLTVTQVTAPLN